MLLINKWRNSKLVKKLSLKFQFYDEDVVF